MAGTLAIHVPTVSTRKGADSEYYGSGMVPLQNLRHPKISMTLAQAPTA
jgi:hypothetical protein